MKVLLVVASFHLTGPSISMARFKTLDKCIKVGKDIVEFEKKWPRFFKQPMYMCYDLNKDKILEKE
ncbi:MAG: hypothetical protein ACFFKA_08960 [Candidatus Thorarchaeota archaeon]